MTRLARKSGDATLTTNPRRTRARVHERARAAPRAVRPTLRPPPRRLSSADFTSSSELLAALATAKSRRATHATGANAVSSRSHAVCTIELCSSAADGPCAGKRRPPAAVLTLVDCAGSERKEDSATHNSDRRKEGAEINASLHVLQECMRQWVATEAGRQQVHIPFRQSALTRVLANSFTRSDTRMAVIGTVSPASTDAEHSLATLRVVCQIGAESGVTRETRQAVKSVGPPLEPVRPSPKTYDVAAVRGWLARACSGAFAPLLPVVSPSLDGRGLMKLSAKQMASIWGVSEEIANAIFSELRAEARRAEESQKARRAGMRAHERKKFG